MPEHLPALLERQSQTVTVHQMIHRFHHREADGTDIMCCGARFRDGEILDAGPAECVVCNDPETWPGAS